MFYFDLSILSNFFSVELFWKFTQWVYSLKRGFPLKSSSGNQTFIWGSNQFSGCPNVLAVNNKPTIKVETLGNRLYLSAEFYDKTGKIVMIIIRNKITLNRNNVFSIDVWRRDKLRIVNQFNESIEIVAHKTGEIELNGVFYCAGNRFEASPTGLRIN